MTSRHRGARRPSPARSPRATLGLPGLDLMGAARALARAAAVVAVVTGATPAAAQEPGSVPAALLPPPSSAAKVLLFADALSRAERANQDIATARERAIQSAARRDRAWAAFKPNLRMQGTYTHRDKGVEFGGRTITLQDELSGNITASMQLLDARAIKAIQASYEALRAARADAETVRRALLWETARTYWSAVAADTLVAVAARNVEKAEVSLRTARDRLDAGVAIPIDVSRAELVLLQAQRDQLSAENAREGLLEVLRFLISADEPVMVERSPLQVVVPPQATIEEATSARPDLEAARARRESAEHLAEGAWWSMLPKLNMVFTYQASENTGFSGDTDSWDIRLVAEWLVYDGGARYADIEETSAEERIGALAVEKAERAVARDVRRLALDVRAADATLKTVVRQRDVASQQYELIHARADLGEATSLEISDADAALFAAEAEVVRSGLQRDLSSMGLMEALSVDPHIIAR